MQRRQGWQRVVPTIAGVLAGILTSVALRALPGPEPATTVRGVMSREEEVVTTRIVTTRVDGGVVADPVGAGPSEPLLSPAAMAQRRRATEAELAAQGEQGRAWHREAIARHRSASVDTTWAPIAESRLAGEFSDAVQRQTHGQIESVNCRTDTCEMQLVWPSYSDATENALRVMHSVCPLNCNRSMSLTDPEAPGQPYRASFLIDCGGIAQRGIVQVVEGI